MTTDIPVAARRLGYAGLIPFAANALMIWLFHQPEHLDQLTFVTLALQAWGAVILSFMAAIPWALGMARPELGARTYWVPSLLAGLAWIGMLMPAYAGLVVLGGALIGCYTFDRRIYPLAGLSHWLTLRFRLTAVAAFFCFFGAAGA